LIEKIIQLWTSARRSGRFKMHGALHALHVSLSTMPLWEQLSANDW